MSDRAYRYGRIGQCFLAGTATLQYNAAGIVNKPEVLVMAYMPTLLNVFATLQQQVSQVLVEALTVASMSSCLLRHVQSVFKNLAFVIVGKA